MSLLFLRLNGIVLEATQEQKYQAFLSLASGDLDEKKLATWIEQRVVRRKRR